MREQKLGISIGNKYSVPTTELIKFTSRHSAWMYVSDDKKQGIGILCGKRNASINGGCTFEIKRT